jgi:membrane protease YdiL (CAAX protease family)
MPDPTTPVLTAAFSGALALFIVTAVIRAMRKSKPATVVEIEATADAQFPYEAPLATSLPPPLPSGVPTWFYRKLDFLPAGVIFAIFAYLSISTSQMDPSKIKFDAPVLLSSMGFSATLAILTTLVVAWRIDVVRWLGLRWAKWPWVFLIAPATVVGIWILFGVLQATGYMKWMESLGVESTQETVKLLQTATDPTILTLMGLAAVVVAPICEEIVFRGYLYPFAKKFSGPWVAAICSGVVFAAAHGSLAALLPLAIFGFLLAVIYEKTGSLWATMAIHFCFNGATVAIQALARAFPHLIEQAK